MPRYTRLAAALLLAGLAASVRLLLPGGHRVDIAYAGRPHTVITTSLLVTGLGLAPVGTRADQEATPTQPPYPVPDQPTPTPGVPLPFPTVAPPVPTPAPELSENAARAIDHVAATEGVPAHCPAG